MKKVAVVIGVGEGLGKSLAKQFGNNDYRVFMMARNLEKLNSIAEELKVSNIEAIPVQTDITDQAIFTNSLNKIKESTTGIDTLIYNAGITAPDGDSLTVDQLKDHLNLDVIGAFQAVVELQDKISESMEQSYLQVVWPPCSHSLVS
ncbi:SDR family NAD(P)-dependent oxidoreductase [Companilactobacillus kimchiensis]|uniref:Short-chain dehydrogenase reductase SDR n=1 Tax=Companilactobacillus kimchiensis TaxID=993692 RepID=A0A0R2LMS9_9LACO|nr:SDR family NAD(P)-dependent oxidoreductase [Companilactobacillus kimchiensis]KRO00720.1 hypothetical protein IV57_GL000038 [Companilactobacillus kimchiensis]